MPYRYIVHPTRSVSALKKWPRVVVTKNMIMSDLPKQQSGGRIANTGRASLNRTYALFLRG